MAVQAAKMQKILTRFNNLQVLHLSFLFDCTDDVLTLVGQHCPKLKEIVIPDSYKPSEDGRGLVALSRGCPDLQVFSMQGYKGPDEALMALGRGCKQLKKLRLRSAAMGDAVLEVISSNCKKIEELDISFNDVTDTGLKALGKGLPLLKRLDLKHCKHITGEGIANVAEGCALLEVLHLGVVEIGEKALTAIGNNSNKLEELYLDYGWGKWGKLSRESVAAVAKGCPELKLLSLRGSKQVDDEVLQGLARGCPSLTELDLHACDRVGDDGLRSVIRGCKQLKNLVLSGTGVGASLEDLFKGELPNLNTLRLSGELITDRVMKSVATNCKELSEFYLANCKISDEGVEQLLQGCKKLKSLTVKASPMVTGNGFTVRSTSLETLCLPNCGITDDGLSAVMQACKSLHHLSVSQCRELTASGLMGVVSSCASLKELIMAGCLQVSREEVLAITKTARLSLKTLRVS
eukprot:jgi/Mesen1/6411/ME000329S05580